MTNQKTQIVNVHIALNLADFGGKAAEVARRITEAIYSINTNDYQHKFTLKPNALNDIAPRAGQLEHISFPLNDDDIFVCVVWKQFRDEKGFSFLEDISRGFLTQVKRQQKRVHKFALWCTEPLDVDEYIALSDQFDEIAGFVSELPPPDFSVIKFHLEDLETALKKQLNWVLHQIAESAISGAVPYPRDNQNSFAIFRKIYAEEFIALHNKYGILSEQFALDDFYIEPYLTQENIGVTLQISSGLQINHYVNSVRPESPRSRISLREFLDQIYDMGQLAVVGHAGVGKTTFLERVGIEIARQGKKLPVYVQLSRYAAYLVEIEAKQGKLEYFLQFLATNFSKFADITPQVVRQTLRDNKLLLLLDAVDEISDPRLRMQVISTILDIIELAPECSILVTARSANYEPYITPTIPRKILLPFDQDQLITYIEHFAELYPQVQQLVSLVSSDENFATMLQNPLLLKMLVERLVTNPGDHTLPQNRILIYQGFVKALIEDRPKTRRRIIDPDRPLVGSNTVQEYLRQLAFDMQHASKWQADQEFILKSFKSVNPGESSYERDLSYIVEETGILTHDEYKTNYRFQHPTFQEFFTAGYFKQRSDQEWVIPFLFKRSTFSQWHETITLYYAYVDDKDANALLESLLKEPDNIFSTRTMLVVDCVASALNRVPNFRLVARILEKLEQNQWQNDYVLLRRLTLEKIIELGSNAPGYLETIYHTLKAKHPYEPTPQPDKALFVLTQVTSPQVASLLCEICSASSAIDINISDLTNAFVAVAHFSVDQSVELLMAYRNSIEKASLMLETLIKSPDFLQEQRTRILQKLSSVHELARPLHIQILQHLGTVNDVDIQGWIAQKFEEFLQASDTELVLVILESCTTTIPTRITSYVHQFIQHRDPNYLLPALGFASRMPDEGYLEDLFSLLYEGDRSIQSAAISALGCIATTSSEELVIDFLKESPDEILCKRGIAILSQYGGMQSLNELATVLAGITKFGTEVENELIIEATYNIITRAKLRPKFDVSPSILGCLGELRQSTQRNLRRVCVALLDYLSVPDADIALSRLADQRTHVAEAIFDYCLETPSSRFKSWANLLAEKYFHDDRLDQSQVQTLAFRLNLELSTYKRDILLQGLEHQNLAIQQVALQRANIVLNEQEMLGICERFLRHDSLGVVETTIDLLGEIGDADVVTVLLPMLETNYRERVYESLYLIARRHELLGEAYFESDLTSRKQDDV